MSMLSFGRISLNWSLVLSKLGENTFGINTSVSSLIVIVILPVIVHPSESVSSKLSSFDSLTV